MRANWTEVPRDHVRGQWSALYVTLNKRGFIVMSRLTYERAGGPKAFLVLFDTVNNKIGLKPTALGIRNAYPVGPSGRHGGKLVRVYRMLQEFSIDVPETLHFRDAEIDQDGMLVLDLRTARASSRAKTQKKVARPGGDVSLRSLSNA
ncbi:MAG: hypothetical protein ABI878_08075 [Acidobacteriota bacterium]